jgi:hypothetical protein
MNYVIVSPRIGEPGTPFTPRPGINIEALLEHGLIKPAPKTIKNTKETE